MGHYDISVLAHEDIAGLNVPHFESFHVESIADISKTEEQVPKLAFVEFFVVVYFPIEDLRQQHIGKVLILNLKFECSVL